MNLVSWFTDNRSELVDLGAASTDLVRTLVTCYGIYVALRHGIPAPALDVVWALRDLYGAGVDVKAGIIKLYRKNRKNGKGAPTASNDRAPFRQ